MGMTWFSSLMRDPEMDPVQQFRESAENKAQMATVEGLVRHLRLQLARQALLNQAMWELTRERLGVTDEELKKKAQEIDQRDGTADGQVTEGPVRCPGCGRVSNLRHEQCLYCGASLRAAENS